MELNNNPSFILQFGFIFVSLSVVAWWIWVSNFAYNQYDISEKRAAKSSVNKIVLLVSTLLLSLWLIGTAVFSFQELAHQFDVFPPPGLQLMLVLVAITITLAMTKPGKILSHYTPLYLLVGFQMFRIPVELLIHQAYEENITIIEMTYVGHNFDILTGVSALIVAFLLVKRELPRIVLFVWNSLGLALLINVVVTGIFSMPHPMQTIATDFPNVWITFFPFIWLPAILVCSALFGHLLVFRYLWICKKQSDSLIAQAE